MRSTLAKAALSLALLGCSCSDPDKQAKEQASWAATVRMTAEAWLAGSVPTRFAIDTLETAAREAKTARYEALKAAIQKHDPRGVREILTK